MSGSSSLQTKQTVSCCGGRNVLVFLEGGRACTGNNAEIRDPWQPAGAPQCRLAEEMASVVEGESVSDFYDGRRTRALTSRGFFAFGTGAFSFFFGAAAVPAAEGGRRTLWPFISACRRLARASSDSASASA